MNVAFISARVALLIVLLHFSQTNFPVPVLLTDTSPLVVAVPEAVTTKIFALVSEETIYDPSAELPDVKFKTRASPTNNL